MVVKNGTRPLPANLEAEQAVLGSCLLDRDAILALAPILNEDDFSNGTYAVIYKAIVAMYRRRVPVDIVTLNDELESRGALSQNMVASLAELMTAVPTAVHAEYYAGIVRDHAMRRRLIQAAADIVKSGFDEETSVNILIEQATETIRTAVTTGNNGGFVNMSKAVDLMMMKIDATDDVVIPTGFYDLDRYYLAGGLRGGELAVIAARTSVGKTALAVQVMHHVGVRLHRPVGIVSLEMSIPAIASRLTSIQGDINMHNIRGMKAAGALDDATYERIATAGGQLSNHPLYILDSTDLNISNLTARVTEFHAMHGLDCLIVDYLQLVTSAEKSENRNLEVAQVSRALKALSLSLDIPIIALSQLNRAAANRGEDARPRLHDLRESGAIEQDADMVIFIHRDQPARDGWMPNDEQQYGPNAELIVAKHREGPTGEIPMLWSETQARFLNIAKETR